MERVVVIGGGVGGLAVALALQGGAQRDAHSSRGEIVIVERDPPPPSIGPQDAFDQWARPGVPQFRHAHILLARLHTTLRDRHPELLHELRAAGLTPSELSQMLPSSHVDGFQPEPEDRDLLHLWGRRATFEYIVRRYVERLAHVTFIHEARAERVLTEPCAEGLRATGVEIRRHAGREVLQADIVVDASGTRSPVPDWLAAEGAAIDVETHESHYAYYCRHYRLDDSSHEPSRDGTGANLDYLWYGIFYAEEGHFAIAVACPVDEPELVDVLKRAEGFERVCQQMPVLERWTRHAHPTTQVMGARGLQNRWRRYAVEGEARVLSFFAVGDSHITTNPMYGRGCSSAFVQAHALAEALSDSAEPAARLKAYEARCRAQLRSHFDSCVAADRLFQSRARRQRGARLPWRDRVVDYLYDSAWTPALLHSPLVAREMLRAMQMREVSNVWTRMRMLFQIAAAFVRTHVGIEAKQPPRLGPDRRELLAVVSASGSSHEGEASRQRG